MFQRFFVIGVMGAIGLVVGCSSWPSSALEKTPTTRAEERPQATADLTAAGKADKTKQVTIAVTGMT
jgi:hypothetical protein